MNINARQKEERKNQMLCGYSVRIRTLWEGETMGVGQWWGLRENRFFFFWGGGG